MLVICSDTVCRKVVSCCSEVPALPSTCTPTSAIVLGLFLLNILMMGLVFRGNVSGRREKINQTTDPKSEHFTF